MILLSACDRSTEKIFAVNEDKKEKKVTKRDLSITAGNACSDMFLDSSIIAAYLDSSTMEQKNVRRFLSFYNARNYQYAWFSKEGLTEHAIGFYNLYLFDSKQIRQPF